LAIAVFRFKQPLSFSLSRCLGGKKLSFKV
jgi:hypothetical protein